MLLVQGIIGTKIKTSAALSESWLGDRECMVEVAGLIGWLENLIYLQ